MNRTIGTGRLVWAVALPLTLVAAGVWAGCTGDDTTTNNPVGKDAGKDTGPAPSDAAGGDAAVDGGAGEGGGGDSGGVDSGGGDAGSDAASVTCNDYCDRVLASCTGANGQYSNRDQCLAMCAKLPTGAATTGNTVACRHFHAGLAGGDGGAAVHCPHAGAYGGGVCGSRCEAFCALTLGLCATPNPQPFADVAACTRACGADGGAFDFDPDADELATSAANTLNCRQYHLANAYVNPDAGSATTHCPHIGLPDAGGTICK